MPQQTGFDPSKPFTVAAPSAGGFDLSKPFTVGAAEEQKKQEPAPLTWDDVGDFVKHLGIGGAKATGRTMANMLQMADMVLGGGTAPAKPALDYIKGKIGEPTGTAEKIGGGLADVAAAVLPAGEIGKAADAAELAAKAYGPFARIGARAVVQGGAAAGTAALQDQSPTVAGAIGGTLGGAAQVGREVAPLVKSSAVKSMIRALGPSGGRGPTSEENFAKAEKIAPGLLDEGFGAATQTGARAKAATSLDQAGNDVKSLLNSPVASQDFNQPELLRQVQAKRAALLIDPQNGQPPYLPGGLKGADDLWAEIESDVHQLGSNPSQRALEGLKSKWNSLASFAAKDPAAGTTKAVYNAGGDIVRGINATEAPQISAANQLFSQAADLSDVLGAKNVRQPGVGVLANLSPYARPAIGAAVGGGLGYREGGTAGAVAGGMAGMALGSLAQSAGFRYLSANTKNLVANAMQSGNSAKISQALSIATDELHQQQGQLDPAQVRASILAQLQK